MKVYILMTGEMNEGESLEDVFTNVIDAKSVIPDVDWKYDEHGKYWSANNPVKYDYPGYWIIYEKEIK